MIRYYINRRSLSFESYSSSIFKNSDFRVYRLYGSNHRRGPNNNVMHFLERNGIPYHYLHTTEENKREREILELVLNTDFLVLARYMQVNEAIYMCVCVCITILRYTREGV